VKKKAGLDPLTGLAAETLVIAPLALLWLVRTQLAGLGSFGGPDPWVTALLAIAGLVTAVPLLLFAAAANRISLQRIGFVQYLSPTGQLALGLFVFKERLSPSLALAFVTVVVAVALYVSTRGRSKAGASGAVVTPAGPPSRP
jgi:chloramphenicol-sensitive protein RarD